MRYIKVIILTLLSLCVLCGCQSTPDEVRDNMREYGENEQLDKSDITYFTVEDLRKTKASDLVLEGNNNIEFPEDVDFSDIESVELIDMTYEENVYDDRDRYMKLFNIPDNGLEYDEDEDGRSVMYYTDDTNFHVCDDGFIAYRSGLSKADMDMMRVQNDAYYDIERDDISGVEISLNGHTVKLQEMVDKTKKWLDENRPAEGLEYIVAYACKQTLLYDNKDEKNKLLSFEVELEHNGIRLNNHASGEWMHYSIEISYDTPDYISYFGNGGAGLRVEPLEKVTDIVDIKSAAAMVNEKLTGFAHIKIDKIVPIYTMNVQEFADTEEVYLPGRKLDTRPVYAFLIKDPDYEGYNSTGILNINSYQSYILVDMITGEMITDIEK